MKTSENMYRVVISEFKFYDHSGRNTQRLNAFKVSDKMPESGMEGNRAKWIES